MRRSCTVALALLLAGCATPPRTTTPRERLEALDMLLTVETTLVVLQTAGQIEPDDFNRAMATLAELRNAVERSETQPVSWSSVLLQIANIAARWVGVPPAPVQPGGAGQ